MEKKKDFPVKSGAPALRALANKKITTLQQLAAYPEKDISELHGIGNNALLILREALAEKGLSLKNS
jgi:DNA-directed RNA polymerase alpha subunit